MEHLQTERDSLAQEVRRLRKHANALKISGRLRRIHADGAGAHADSSLCLHAAECIDSLLRELERMDRAFPHPYRNFKLTNATIASVIATR
jgi:hypothetical protein